MGAISGGLTAYLYTTPQWPWAIIATVGMVMFVLGLMIAEDPPGR